MSFDVAGLPGKMPLMAAETFKLKNAVVRRLRRFPPIEQQVVMESRTRFQVK